MPVRCEPVRPSPGDGEELKMFQRRCRVRASVIAVPLTVAIALAGSLAAGPTWNGDLADDAGETPQSGAQVTNDTKAALVRIEGTTGSLSPDGIPDLADMYVIRICDPEQFSASLLQADGGGSQFPTELYLFRAINPNVGIGRLGNDDADDNTPLSRLTAESTDGSGAVVSQPGRFFLAVSRQGYVPLSGGDNPIFQIPPGSTEISGPDGPGGGAPIDGWGGDFTGAEGFYAIALEGVTFGNGPDLDCNCNGILDRCDIFLGNSADENENGIPDECECREDIVPDGVVDFDDLLELLTVYGPCSEPGCPGDFNCNGIVGFQDLVALLAAWGPCSD